MGKAGGEELSVVSYCSLPQDGGKEFMCVKDTHKKKETEYPRGNWTSWLDDKGLRGDKGTG